ISACVSRCPKYPGGEPISFAISCECWNSAQSTLITARGSPNRISAAASTMRVLPEPVGPKNSRLPTGRPGEFSPAQNTWYKSTSACTPSSCPTIFDRRALSKSRVSLLRMLGFSCCLTAGLIGLAPVLVGLAMATLCLNQRLQLPLCRIETIPNFFLLELNQLYFQ